MRNIAIAGSAAILSSCGPSHDDASRSQNVIATAAFPVPSARPALHAADAKPPRSVSPCLLQGSDSLAVRPRRAVGTEPFWGARIEGRCVIYSTPEDQDGTRIWTRYSEAAGVERWSGMLHGQPFELHIRSQPACSDGMSDKRYGSAAAL